eukprot:1487343-Pleurochrysis_carterae.AAC.3
MQVLRIPLRKMHGVLTRAAPDNVRAAAEDRQHESANVAIVEDIVDVVLASATRLKSSPMNHSMKLGVTLIHNRLQIRLQKN